jgi:hypothetical protein
MAGLGFKKGATTSTRAVTCFVKPITSQDPAAARLSVLHIYKEFQRLIPEMWWDFEFIDIPLPVFREAIKKEFLVGIYLYFFNIVIAYNL